MAHAILLFLLCAPNGTYVRKTTSWPQLCAPNRLPAHKHLIFRHLCAVKDTFVRKPFSPPQLCAPNSLFVLQTTSRHQLCTPKGPSVHKIIFLPPSRQAHCPLGRCPNGHFPVYFTPLEYCSAVLRNCTLSKACGLLMFA